ADRVGGAQGAELRRRDRLTRLLRAREADVAVHDLGVRDLLRFVERGEVLDARVRHLGDADVRLRLGAGKSPGRRVRAGQEVEESGLPDVGQSRDRGDDVHVASRVSRTSGGSSWKIERAMVWNRSTDPVQTSAW